MTPMLGVEFGTERTPQITERGGGRNQKEGSTQRGQVAATKHEF